jgi:hypothetical protein
MCALRTIHRICAHDKAWSLSHQDNASDAALIVDTVPKKGNILIFEQLPG